MKLITIYSGYSFDNSIRGSLVAKSAITALPAHLDPVQVTHSFFGGVGNFIFNLFTIVIIVSPP